MAAIHVVYARLHDPALREDVVDELRARLVALGAGVEIGVPADAHCEAAWDLCLHARFATRKECAEAVVEGGPVSTIVSQTLGERAKVVKAWSFAT